MSTADASLPPISRNTRLFAIGALAVAATAFAVITFGGLGENLVYYWNPTDLKANADKAVGATIRLGGLVAPGTIDFDGTNRLAFSVTDGKEQVLVKATGVPPAMFRENIGVVVEGTMTTEGHFTSSRLMVSHDNEYRIPEDGQPVDTEALFKSVLAEEKQ